MTEITSRLSTALVARWGWYATVFLALLGMASVVTHLTMWDEAVWITLSFDPSVPDSSAELFEVRYYMHPVLTLVHILPGFVVMALGPLQFLPAVRARH